MNRLSTIAIALGPERTCKELIPFLEEVTREDEDEVLTVLAQELGNFAPYMGGPENAHLLLPTLEILSSFEEPVVRDKAVEAINKLCDTQTTEQIDTYFIPLIKRLSNTDWFSSRVSSTGLFATVISKVPTATQEELLDLYKTHCQDEAPMVRRAAATNLPKIIEILPDVKFEGSIFSMFQSQVTDDQDSVRLLSVDVLIAIAEALKKQDITRHNPELVKFSNTLFTDKSWRVRYMAAERFEKLALSLDSPEARNRFVPDFVNLMKDDEAEVRTAISKQIPGFSALVSKDTILSEIIPNVDALSQDSSQHVRAALASEISRLAPFLGKEDTINSLLPIFLIMLKDEFPDVRLNIISKLHIVNDVIGIDLLSKSLLPAISDLAKDKQWRVRLAIIEYIPLLAEQLGVSFFDRELGPLCMTWLWDTVYSIREAATLNLRKLAEVFGIEWAKEEIIPHIIVVGANTNYLYRLTVLFAVTVLIPVLDTKTINDSIIPFLNNLMNDPIPNIRFNVAKTFKVLVEAYLKPQYPIIENSEKQNPTTESSEGDGEKSQSAVTKATLTETLGPRGTPEEINTLITETIIPNLEKLAEDNDVDVRYFANKSLQEIDELVKEAFSS